MFDAVTFDLDGTLIDALPDLTASTNAALRYFSLPERSEQEMLACIGKGMRYQIEQASGLTGDDLDLCVSLYERHYARHCTNASKPYDGMFALLQRLHGAGIRIAVITNKPEAIARNVVDTFFPGCVDVIVGGDREGVALKPDPSGILLALREMGAKSAAHVGDGATDVKAAKAAGLPVIGVLWGYNTKDKLEGADTLIESPDEFMPALEKLAAPKRKSRPAPLLAVLLALVALVCVFALYDPYPMAEDGGMAVSLLLQTDYPETVCTVDGIDRSVKTSGCGATCVAMAAQYFRGEKERFSPPALFKWAYQNGYYYGSGMDKNGMKALAEHCGLQSEWTDSTEDVLSAFQKKRLVIGYMGEGEFTRSGHFILLRGVNEEGRVLVNDPNSEERCEKTYALSFLYGQLKYHPGFMILWK